MNSHSHILALAPALLFLLACGGGGGDGGEGPSTPNGKDSVSTVIGTSGGVVTTPSSQAGVQVPAGAFSQPVTITVERLPSQSTPGQGPLTTSMNQYGPFYEVQVSPANAVPGDSIRIGVCQVTDPSSPFYAPEATHNRLRLAHTVGNTVEVLPPVGVNDFLRCTNVTAEGRESNPLKRFASRIFSPRSAYAAHGGLGGKTKSFSPFGAVDPITVGPEFNISATSDQDDFGGIAWNGTNYLVFTVTRKAGNTSSTTMSAQFVSPTGALVGNPIPIPAADNGNSGQVAFDGTNFLLAWSDNGSTPAIRGQFLSRTGALVGSSFAIVPVGPASPSQLRFGGGTYFLSYTRSAGVVNGENTFNTFGRLITTAGVSGPQINLSTINTGDGFNNVAFDGTNFFTVYANGTSVRGRFVSPGGVVSPEKTLLNGQFGDFVTVIWSSPNYLVAYPVTSTSRDAAVVLVDNAGNVVSGPATIANGSGDELPIAVTVTADNDYLVSYIDSLTVAGKATTKARFVTSAGVPRGPGFTITSPSGGKVTVGYVVGGIGNSLFTLLFKGIPPSATPQDTDTWAQADVVGRFITVNVPP